jgi:iron complex outermembrane receptor protein/outer membrane receptor for ferrienterochelin and colicins
MKKYVWLLGITMLSIAGFAQNTLRILVKDSSNDHPVPNVSVVINNEGKTTESDGSVVFSNLPGGNYPVTISAVGFLSKNFLVSLPDTATHIVLLERKNAVLEDVTVIATTRGNQQIENSPLKVEVLGKEDMDEENTIRPANIASILGDISGVQIQQSSATSGNSNVRIQGLDGRYTQILRDGMPLFEGFSGNFGVLTIPPLDLKQIELVKGSASTLYGGGAIGGLVNLISKRPTMKGEDILTLNQTTLKESDVNAYLSKRYKHVGYTFFSGYTHQNFSDINKDTLSDVPKLSTFIIHPRLFLYPSESTTIIAGYTGTFERRKGGDVLVLDGKQNSTHQYYEENKTKRNTGEFIVESNLSTHLKGTIKASLSDFDRTINTNVHFFHGKEFNYYTEASALLTGDKADWVGGINFIGDEFRKKPSDPILLNDFSDQTIGVFLQNTYRFKENDILETGLRLDHHFNYGDFLLPRIALFHRFNEKWASRFGFGMGYKTPNALAPQNIEYDIEQIFPLSANVKSERSYGFNAEVNYKKEYGDGNSFFINQAFFLTQLNSPIIANELASGTVVFNNESKPLISKGFDTYVQWDIKGWEVYAGYTFTIAERNYLQKNRFVPLTPKNRFATVIARELSEKFRFGLEGSYAGRQYRYDATKTPGFLFVAAMIGYNFNPHIGLVLNCENLLDYRQSKHEALYEGAITNPQFKPLWAPIDGRAVNLSLRLKK